ncbi:EamA/RhaT family transporter, partial [Pseudomonas aeruginosa]
MRTPAWLGSGMPLLFVLLWSTGFLGAKFGLPYAEPFPFLAIRLLLPAALLAAFPLLSGSPSPSSPRLPRPAPLPGLLAPCLYPSGACLARQHVLSSR